MLKFKAESLVKRTKDGKGTTAPGIFFVVSSLMKQLDENMNGVKITELFFDDKDIHQPKEGEYRTICVRKDWLNDKLYVVVIITGSTMVFVFACYDSDFKKSQLNDFYAKTTIFKKKLSQEDALDVVKQLKENKEAFELK